MTKMKFGNKMEVALISITSILCVILFLKILFKLRTNLPWRVNCWFCNSNAWVKFLERNSWTCLKCEQYNGFTKDGDYNKTVFPANHQEIKTPKVFQKSPPKNGFCKMCNINQQLKVTQLANFVPMNENNFNDEIEGYRAQLEKAYRLCSPCKKVLQMKLHKEKETLLGIKLLQTRIPNQTNHKEHKQNQALKNIINNTSLLIAAILFILVSYELYKNLTIYENLPKTITNVIQIMKSLLDRVYSILKIKMFLTFPSLESYIYDNYFINLFDIMPLYFSFIKFGQVNMTTQMALGGFVCLIQIVANVFNVNSLKSTIVLDLLWSLFVCCLANNYITLDPIITGLIKISSALALIVVYKKMRKITKSTPRVLNSSVRMKNLANTTVNPFIDEDDMTVDTDDDVSLCKFGVNNISESSNETISPLNASLLSGRCFTPRSDGVWTKPKLNSTFCVNSVMCKSPSSVSDTVFAKPSFNKYQKLARDDSDSDLDESISSLSLGSPKKPRKKSNSIFSLRKFTATPQFARPMPAGGARPLISPSKLGHSTSWVAGGYWGAESERQSACNADGSRSSSQSSGFESQTSSVTQRAVFSQPPSREDSVCGEPMVLDRFPTMSQLSYPLPAPARRSPVFPQLHVYGHVQLPRPACPQPQFVPGSLFKAPGGSGLIKLSKVNSFTSR